LYDRLAPPISLAFSPRKAPSAGQYDLAIAADVSFTSTISPNRQRGARVMAPDGILAFTVETHAGDG